MNPINKFWWFVATSAVITLVLLFSLAWLFWQQLTPAEKIIIDTISSKNFIYIFSAILLIAGCLIFVFDGILHVYILPAKKLTGETHIINSVNHSHRICIEGSRDIMRLAEAINEGAERYENLQRNVDEMIHFARTESEKERNILAAVMSELPEGILICNSEGQIILYNKKARQLFESRTGLKQEQNLQNGLVGIGRSVFGIIEKKLLVHALDEIAAGLKEANRNVSSFITVSREEKLLRAEAVPVLNHLKQITGFILIFEDITEQLEKESRFDSLLLSFTRGVRASIAGIRSAIEVVLEYPDIKKEQLNEFTGIIHRESITLGNMIDETFFNYSCRFNSMWPLVKMSAADLIETVKKKAEEKPGVTIHFLKPDIPCWIKVDTYSMITAFLFLLEELENETGQHEFRCSIECKNKFIMINIMWEGNPLKIETFRVLDKKIIRIEKEGKPLTLKEIMKHHEAEAFSFVDRNTANKSCIRLLLPSTGESVSENTRNLTILPESRPVFYDFDLFNQPGQVPEMDNRPLSELIYTVFDTETTGLNPEEDEIISVGAIRIVNGHLLRDESFDQLVNPGRTLPFESIQFHGIEEHMLQNQPSIEQVLPRFGKFAEGTVLVAHNAAFDMRMLQMKESKSKIKFINPVLDTMLLSAIVHPAHTDHNLEAIAARLGVSIIGRHTALGDAIATGELFTKLIPLLSKMGIYTLKQAREASRKTQFAKIKY
ncbi:MAG: DNA polymerase III subunit epsilon [Desulfobacteraceae bacterium]|nr:MAG: DNA polymerase III subunit epsilon [Desulfobacteraceae bacterium]